MATNDRKPYIQVLLNVCTVITYQIYLLGRHRYGVCSLDTRDVKPAAAGDVFRTSGIIVQDILGDAHYLSQATYPELLTNTSEKIRPAEATATDFELAFEHIPRRSHHQTGSTGVPLPLGTCTASILRHDCITPQGGMYRTGPVCIREITPAEEL